MATKAAIGLCAILALLAVPSDSLAQEVTEAPPNLQAALLSKAMAFDKTLSGNITIYVLGAPAVAEELGKLKGRSIGGATLASVEEGDALPSSVPAAMFIGDESLLADALAFTQSNHVLSLTGLPHLVQQGVTLGVGVVASKPKILLNVSSSKQEAREWDQTILSLAQIHK